MAQAANRRRRRQAPTLVAVLQNVPSRLPPIAVPGLSPKRNQRWERRTTGGRGMDHLLIGIRPTSRRRAGAGGGDTRAKKIRRGRRTKSPRSRIEGAIGVQVGVPDGRHQGRSRIPWEEKCRGLMMGGRNLRDRREPQPTKELEDPPQLNQCEDPPQTN